METPEQKLQALRARIDAVDESLARLLIERIGIIREVAVLKAKNWPKSCHIRPGREGQMHRALTKRFTDTGFPPRMALAMWRQLIGGSTHVESPLAVTYDAHFPEHYWLAREYFGVQVEAHAAADLEEALTQIRVSKSTILLLPTDLSAPCWAMGQQLRDAGLFIFAVLPVEAGPLPGTNRRAFALAAVTPEDSGDDISYFLSKSGAMEIVAGFQTTHGDALYLGSHPRPIQLDLGAVHV